MSKVTGVVDAVKSFPAAGGATMYSLIVNGERYGCGSKEPRCKAGDTVSFDVVQKGQYLNADMKSLTIEAGAARAFTKSASAPADTRQETISKQAALNTAIAFVKLVADSDALPGPTAKMSVQDKYDIIEALVDRKAREFFSFSTGNDLPESEASSAKQQAEAPAKSEW